MIIKINLSLFSTLKKLFFLSLLLLPFSVFANFDFNANCLKAYQQLLELKINTGRQTLALEKKIHPNNAIVALLENYADYFYLLTTENKQDFERLEVKKDERLSIIKDNDKNSPYYYYAQAEINLQWALIRGRYGEYFTAAREINKANTLLLQNTKKFPAFVLNTKGLALINVLIGSLPDGFLKTTLAAFGIKGNQKTGLTMLDKLAETLPKSSFEPFYEETIFCYAYVLTDIVYATNAYAKIIKYTERFADSSLLKTYLQAYTAIKNQHNDEAITILANKPSGNVYQAFPYLDYLMGVAKLNKLDETAGTYFEKFLQSNKGVNYTKDAYLRLGMLSILKGDFLAYNAFMAKVKNNGYTYHEKDKQALNEANTKPTQLELLKARLLFDGGYYQKALAILPTALPEKYTLAKDKTEYYYRLARINEGLSKDQLAIENYQIAINLGKNLTFYYAARSALQMAKIYEQKKNFTKAKTYFNTAISFKNHEFETGIENQAKEGLKRMSN